MQWWNGLLHAPQDSTLASRLNYEAVFLRTVEQLLCSTPEVAAVIPDYSLPIHLIIIGICM